MAGGGRIHPLAIAIACMLAALLLMCIIGHGAAFASSPEVIASAPDSGAVAVPCEGRMWVQFENNVASVPGNAELVTLETADGEEVSTDCYQVSLPDVELEFVYRQYIWIDVVGLDAGAGYVICVAPGVTSKNGSVNDAETRIAFTTAAEGEEAIALADPAAVEGGTGKGDGTGGGQGSGQGSNQGDDQVGGQNDSQSDGQGGGSAEAASDVQGDSPSDGEEPGGDADTAPDADGGSSADADGGDDGEVEVLYVDANGNPVKEADDAHEPMPVGEITLFILCGVIVAVALVFAVLRSRANVIRR